MVDFFAKCGLLVEVHQVFDGINVPKKDILTWNAMISVMNCIRKGRV